MVAVVKDTGRAVQPSERARRAVLDQFRWQDGHADLWRLFHDAGTLAAVVDGLAEPWLGRGVTAVCGVESRGFILGGAVAVRLGVGFVAIRKQAGLFPGPKLTVQAAEDYRGNAHLLRMQQGAFGSSDAVVLVDDWAERGSQALAARRLAETAGARWLGVSLMVDQLPAAIAARLGEVHRLVTAAELGDPMTGPRTAG